MDQATQKYRLKEAAQEIGLGLTKLRQEIKRGNIGVEMLGWRTRYIYRAEIDAYKHRHQKNFHIAI